MSEEQLYETHEQKVNTLEDEICNHEKMSAIMDKDLKIDSKLSEKTTRKMTRKNFCLLWKAIIYQIRQAFINFIIICLIQRKKKTNG